MKRVVALVAVGVLAACSERPSSHELATLRINNAALESQVATLQGKLASIEEQGKSLADRLNAIETNTPWGYVDPTEGSGYGIIPSNISPLLVSFAGSSASGDGTSLALRVGNPTTAHYSGMTLTVNYNRRRPESADGLAEWFVAGKSVEHKVLDEISPGRWNYISVPLPGMKPDQLGHLRITVHLDTVAFSTR